METSRKPTRKLYYEDAYATEFSARVLSCRKVERAGRLCCEAVLDQTLFFPEQGGQSPDKGILGSANVLDVQIVKEDTVEVILHYLDEPLEAGDEVQGKIDWAHRFSNMQQHSGEHIFSGIVHRKFGFENVGFHLSDQSVTMDFDGALTEEELEEVEREANQVIYRNILLEVTTPPEEELAHLDYRSKKELEGEIRIVTIPGVDCCACCAPHVRATGEIGLLKIISAQSHKGGVRINFLCGERAMDSIRESHRIVTQLSNDFSTNPGELLSSVGKLRQELQEIKHQRNVISQQLLDLEVAGLDPVMEHAVLFRKKSAGIEQIAIRNVVNKLVARYNGYCGVFEGDDESGYRYIIGSAERDCCDLAGRLREQCGARGGGNAQMIQGQVEASESRLRECMGIG